MVYLLPTSIIVMLLLPLSTLTIGGVLRHKLHMLYATYKCITACVNMDVLMHRAFEILKEHACYELSSRIFRLLIVCSNLYVHPVLELLDVD